MLTADGELTIKRSFGYGVEREKPEYEDLARLARDRGIPLRDIIL